VTPQGIITEVRRLIQDETETYRYSDTFLLGLVNQSLKRMALLRPDLFAYVSTLTCTAGEVIQSAPADSIRVIEVYSIVGGNALIETNRETMDQNVPTWPNDTAGAAVNWFRNVRNPNKFYIYPQAPADQDLNIEYAQSPTDYAIGDTITLLPDAYFPVLVDMTVFLAESIDNEHVDRGRAKLFQDSYTQALGLTTQSRTVTDTEQGGLADGEVI
jgi:hypothetical protein